MKRMLFNATQPEELRVAIVDGQKLIDLDIETYSSVQRKGNIYKGVITKVEGSLEACFVDYGQEKQGFLPFKEISRNYLQFNDGDRSNMKEALKEGMEVLVQVVKDERGNKGAALTTNISLAGRYLVLMTTNSRGGGVSRKVDSETRQEMKSIIQQLEIPKGMSVIVRTAGRDVSIEEIKWDLNYLLQLWDAILTASRQKDVQNLILQESSLIIRSIRDYYQPDIGEILVDTQEAYDKVHSFMQLVMPNYVNKMKFYKEKDPLFTRFQIERQIESAYAREVVLPSGGSIVIDHTEALVSVDVNSARSTKGSDVEETAFQTNMEAAEEVARQMRFRDLGGLIVIDFIDMESKAHQNDVEMALKNAIKHDKARVQMGKLSKFGLMELSRQRLQISLGETTHIACPRCHGTGFIRDIESTAFYILRLIQEEAMKDGTAEVHVQLPVDAATFLLNEKRDELAVIEKRYDVLVVLIPNIYLQTPWHKIVRVRADEVDDIDSPSYKLMELPGSESQEKQSGRKNEGAGQKEEAALQGIRPAAPAPVIKKKSVLRSIGLWVTGLFGKKKKSDKKRVEKKRSNLVKTQKNQASSKKRKGAQQGGNAAQNQQNRNQGAQKGRERQNQGQSQTRQDKQQGGKRQNAQGMDQASSQGGNAQNQGGQQQSRNQGGRTQKNQNQSAQNLDSSNQQNPARNAKSQNVNQNQTGKNQNDKPGQFNVPKQSSDRQEQKQSNVQNMSQGGNTKQSKSQQPKQGRSQVAEQGEDSLKNQKMASESSQGRRAKEVRPENQQESDYQRSSGNERPNGKNRQFDMEAQTHSKFAKNSFAGDTLSKVSGDNPSPANDVSDDFTLSPRYEEKSYREGRKAAYSKRGLESEIEGTNREAKNIAGDNVGGFERRRDSSSAKRNEQRSDYAYSKNMDRFDNGIPNAENLIANVDVRGKVELLRKIAHSIINGGKVGDLGGAKKSENIVDSSNDGFQRKVPSGIVSNTQVNAHPNKAGLPSDPKDAQNAMEKLKGGNAPQTANGGLGKEGNLNSMGESVIQKDSQRGEWRSEERSGDVDERDRNTIGGKNSEVKATKGYDYDPSNVMNDLVGDVINSMGQGKNGILKDKRGAGGKKSETGEFSKLYASSLGLTEDNLVRSVKTAGDKDGKSAQHKSKSRSNEAAAESNEVSSNGGNLDAPADKNSRNKAKHDGKMATNATSSELRQIETKSTLVSEDGKKDNAASNNRKVKRRSDVAKENSKRHGQEDMKSDVSSSKLLQVETIKRQSEE